MKIYETETAPNPRLVRIFLAEKNIPMDYVQVNIKAGDNLEGELIEKNVTTKIPFLELDDGTCIGETAAICRYFEETNPTPALFGESALEKALVEMWRRRVELYFFLPVGMCFQHTTGYFSDRMNPIIEWGQESGNNAIKFLATLEQQLSENAFVAGESFSIADITLLIAIDFARVVKIRVGEEYPNIQRWYQLVSSRSSASA